MVGSVRAAVSWCAVLLCGPALALDLWSRHPRLYSGADHRSDLPPLVVFEPLPDEVCAYDEIRIALRQRPAAGQDVLLAVQSQGGDSTFVRRLPNAGPAVLGVGEKEMVSAVIKCDLNSDDCAPAVDSLGVRHLPDSAVPYRLVIRFGQDTNQAPLSSTEDVLAALDFKPPMTGT